LDDITLENVKFKQIPNISDSIAEYMSIFITGQSARKKIFVNLTKFFHELAKVIEVTVQNRIKTTNKLSHYPKVVNEDIMFIIQIYDYTRSLFEVQIRKFEDILKYIK